MLALDTTDLPSLALTSKNMPSPDTYLIAAEMSEPIRRPVAAPIVSTGALATFILAVSANILVPETASAANLAMESLRAGHDESSSLPSQYLPAAEEMREFAALENGWDGNGSVSPKLEAVNDALAFLALLPVDCSPPDPSVSADGSVDWFWKSPRGVATVSFREGGQFAFLARTAVGTASGVEPFNRMSVPYNLVELIRFI